jgi:stearoyl-CoA desaturase (Delta-9 desaturase)
MSTHSFINPHISISASLNCKKRVSNALDMLLPVIILLCLTTSMQMSWVPTSFAILNTAFFFTIAAFGLAIGYHRFFSHHAFKTSKLGKLILGVLGAWALQGSITSWVADHRRHHRFADKQYDPHSPYTDDNGFIKNRLFGWFHAHIGWMISGSLSEENRYALDCLNDPTVVFLSRYYRYFSMVGFLLPGVMGWFYDGLNEFFLSIFWASCVRTILIQQLAWSANSFGHMFGEKIDGAVDESRNNLLLGVILLGEGLHSYHHKNPTLAMNEPAKFDAFGHALVFLERLGLVWDLRTDKATGKGLMAQAQLAQGQTPDLQGTATI